MKKKQRTDEDYIALDEAGRVLALWWPEIMDQLAERGTSWKALVEVSEAIRNIYNRWEETQ